MSQTMHLEVLFCFLRQGLPVEPTVARSSHPPVSASPALVSEAPMPHSSWHPDLVSLPFCLLRLSYNAGWPRTCYLIDAGFELLTVLPLPLKCRDYGHVPPYVA